MKFNKAYFCFNVNNIYQALKAISICRSKKIIPIFFIKFYIINGFGPEWIVEFKNLLLKKFNKSDFMIFVDCRKNYGLFISLVKEKIDCLKVKADYHTIMKLKQIAKKNRITINPKISIIDLTNIKNIDSKINKHLIRKK